MSTLDMTDEPNITTEIEEVSDVSEEEVAVAEEPVVEEPVVAEEEEPAEEPTVEEPAIEEPEPEVESVIDNSTDLQERVKELEERLDKLKIMLLNSGIYGLDGDF